MIELKAFAKRLIPFFLGVRMRGIYQKILGIVYAGHAYSCPFCGRSFRRFLPGGEDHPVIYQKNIIGAGRRQNIICPRCFSKDRDRLVYLYLSKMTHLLETSSRVLHIAPEGALRAYFKKNDKIGYVMGDKHEKGYTDYYYSRDVGYADVTNLDYADNSFDLIVCNHVLEHITDDRKAISELFRVLSPGGLAILQVPISFSIDATEEDSNVISDEERIKMYGQFDHVRLYGPDYRHRLEIHGFRVVQFNPFKEGFGEDAKKFSLNFNEELFIGFKDE